MAKRVGVILFFIVVFGLPIAWYLFLQFFGVNKFDLPVIEKYEVQNCEVRGPVVLSKLSLVQENPNQFDRLLKQLDTNSGVAFYSIDPPCMMGYDLIFIDKDEMVRGQYGSNREEVDRLFAEVDIYLLNEENGEVNSGK